jgi:hypothetical protein
MLYRWHKWHASPSTGYRTICPVSLLGFSAGFFTIVGLVMHQTTPSLRICTTDVHHKNTRSEWRSQMTQQIIPLITYLASHPWTLQNHLHSLTCQRAMTKTCGECLRKSWNQHTLPDTVLSADFKAYIVSCKCYVDRQEGSGPNCYVDASQILVWQRLDLPSWTVVQHSGRCLLSGDDERGVVR